MVWPELELALIYSATQLHFGMDHYFLPGVTIFGTCREFFMKNNHFKQFFSLYFVMETIFLQPFFKNFTGFFIDLF